MSRFAQATRVALERLADGLAPGDIFAIERHQQVGSPSLWEERITLQHGRQMRVMRSRSPVDEGGVPIGRWWSDADPERGRALAAALRDAAVWELRSEPVLPGAEATVWRWVTLAGAGEVCAPAGSMLLLRLADLDLELRRLANTLISSHRGAELACQVSLRPDDAADRLVIVDPALSDGGFLGGIWLCNDGDHPFLLPNPFRSPPRGSDYLRLELGVVPDEQPGVTGLGITYNALSMPVPSRLESPWDAPYIPLRPGDLLECPVEAPLGLRSVEGRGRTLIRAVFSNYDARSSIGGMPVVCGRVFSEEHELTVEKGALRLKGGSRRLSRADTVLSMELPSDLLDF